MYLVFLQTCTQLLEIVRFVICYWGRSWQFTREKLIPNGAGVVDIGIDIALFECFPKNAGATQLGTVTDHGPGLPCQLAENFTQYH